jgi:hypothetical protein
MDAQVSGFLLQRDGVETFRQVLDPGDIRYLRRAADWIYRRTARVKWLSLLPGWAEKNDLIATIAKFDSVWGGCPFDHFVALTSDSFPRVTPIVEEVKRTAAALICQASGAPEAHYKGDIALLRRHAGVDTHVNWHFDAKRAGTIAYDPVYNAWIPFVPVGANCPTLEFLPGSERAMRSGEYTPDGLSDNTGTPTEVWLIGETDTTHSREDRPLSEIQPTPRFHRVAVPMEPGDITIFNHWTLHRTQPLRGRTRTSAEIRFSTKS